jgi:bacterial microcompartment shell protein
MKPCPSIALLEFSSIANGMLAADAMVKKSPVAMLKTGTVSEGKFLVLVGGTVGSVEEAYNEGLVVGSDSIVDAMFLPDVHQRVYDAVFGKRVKLSGESLGVIETCSVAITILASDAAIKGADVEIVEIRLANQLGGKGFALFSGMLEDVESAMSIASDIDGMQEMITGKSIIQNLSDEMIKQINDTTVFESAKFQKLAGGEQV